MQSLVVLTPNAGRLGELAREGLTAIARLSGLQKAFNLPGLSEAEKDGLRELLELTVNDLSDGARLVLESVAKCAPAAEPEQWETDDEADPRD